MKSVFMVAEKPSLAASLASILSNGRHSTHKGKNYTFFNKKLFRICADSIFCDGISGSNNACSIHEWKGLFRNENVTFKMTSVCGHVMSLDFVGEYTVHLVHIIITYMF